MEKDSLEYPRNLKKEVTQKSLDYVLAAFGLVAGFAWNEAIKALIEYIFPLEQNNLVAKFIYAIALTLILVLVSLYLAKIFKKQNGT